MQEIIAARDAAKLRKSGLAEDALWLDDLQREFSSIGFCDGDEDLPLEPLVVDSLVAHDAGRDIHLLLEIARRVCFEFAQNAPWVRTDQIDLAHEYLSAPRREVIARPDCVVSGGKLRIL